MCQQSMRTLIKHTVETVLLYLRIFVCVPCKVYDNKFQTVISYTGVLIILLWKLFRHHCFFFSFSVYASFIYIKLLLTYWMAMEILQSGKSDEKPNEIRTREP